jgi:hypothetical protein
MLIMKVDKSQFDGLLKCLLAQKPEKTQVINGSKQQPRPIISVKPKS